MNITGQVCQIDTELSKLRVLSFGVMPGDVGESCKAMVVIKQPPEDLSGLVEIFFVTLVVISWNWVLISSIVSGEMGRGFAVVADEVRTLAGNSQSSSNEIDNLVKTTVSKIEELAKLIKGIDG